MQHLIKQMQNPIKQILLCAALVITPSVKAEVPGVERCKFPDTPTMVDGATSSQEQMVTMGTAVRSFVGDMQASLECIDEVEAELGEDITPEQKASLNYLYNNGVDQMQAIAESYNEQARAFKAR